MAILSSMGTPYGEATYHMISRVWNDKLSDTGGMIVQSFRDEAHRHTDGAFPFVSRTYEFAPSLWKEASQWDAAYAWLKANQSGSLPDAKDV